VLGLPVVLALGCGRNEEVDERVIARAYEQKLLWSDLRQVVPIGVAAEDSAALATQYINNWLRQRAVLHQAEMNLSDQAKDFQRQLADYRNSLVIYAYEEGLVQQKLDTVVRPWEMEQYLAENGANFELREPILRVRWVKIREEDKRVVKRLEEAFLKGEAEPMHEVEMWLAQRGISFTDHSTSWTTESTLRNDLAMTGPKLPELGTAPRRIVHKETPFTWMIEVLEWKSAGEAAPLELVSTDIRSIIINRRKVQLLERMREDLYRQALENKHVEVL
jgi:hypothetical protein